MSGRVNWLSDKSTPISYGGQAVIEGVMFGGKHVNVTAVRRKITKSSFSRCLAKTRLGFESAEDSALRGIVSLIDSTIKGSKHLNYSADAYADDTLEPEEREKQKEKEDSGWSLSMIIGVAAVSVLSFIFGKCCLHSFLFL